MRPDHPVRIIRPIAYSELEAAYRLELSCYPHEAAATCEAFIYRQRYFPSYFLSAWENSALVGLACGVRTSSPDSGEESVKGDTGTDPEGIHLCVLSVAVDSESRRGGIGTELVEALVRQAEEDRLASIILMCEAHLISFYERVGFEYVRLSSSRHGGIQWHEMKRELGTR
ncbi:GNAT family N-acetyltransferase [Paenibacillus nasutitermitis]|uniref:N-acetyltransferase n=1 Tax=Paenibacillus nasutitermitis TaxID=1652958 RepID=A0A917DS50_9BACL|nr:GNAT family N-acetyltransferase [Paenibacillus nasutitermitis]GGD63605.1 N-acetyltransferase [Paenibacillus nasutitermitis]